jgi:hypothetical protein
MSEIAQLIIGFFSAPAIGLLYWAYSSPEKSSLPSRLAAASMVILAYLAAALLPLLEGERFFSALFVAYPLLYSSVLKQPVRALARRLPLWLSLFGVAALLPWLGELFVVLDYRGDVLSHMVFYTGFYIGFAATLAFLYSRWTFTFTQVFTIGGLWGVLVEQQFAGPAMLVAGLRGDSEALLNFFFFASFIFLVYGLYLAGPYLLFREQLQGRRPAGWLQLALAYVLVVVVPLAAWGLWSLALQWLGVSHIGIQ